LKRQGFGKVSSRGAFMKNFYTPLNTMITQVVWVALRNFIKE